MAPFDEQSEWINGRIRVRVVVGEVVDQPVEAIFNVANTRGMMPAGSPSAIRVHGGAEVERYCMALAPHRIGAIYGSPSGRLAERGVQRVIHAVISTSLGEPPREWLISDAVRSALDYTDREGWRSLALPMIGVTSDLPEPRRSATLQLTIEPVVQFARRRSFHLVQIVLVTRFESDAAIIGQALEVARRRSWT